MISTKYYPFYFAERFPLHLYLQPGFGLVYGKQDIINYIDYLDAGIVLEETQAKFTYMIGAGADWPVADQIALTFNLKYTPVDFKEKLAQIEDYSGWSLTVGVGYIFKR